LTIRGAQRLIDANDPAVHGWLFRHTKVQQVEIDPRGVAEPGGWRDLDGYRRRPGHVNDAQLIEERARGNELRELDGIASITVTAARASHPPDHEGFGQLKGCGLLGVRNRTHGALQRVIKPDTQPRSRLQRRCGLQHDRRRIIRELLPVPIPGETNANRGIGVGHGVDRRDSRIEARQIRRIFRGPPLAFVRTELGRRP
jgi:hypothetical protein